MEGKNIAYIDSITTTLYKVKFLVLMGVKNEGAHPESGDSLPSKLCLTPDGVNAPL